MKREAFTIIEIVIVVAIVCILATLVFPVYRNIVEGFQSTVCEANLKTLQKALDDYAMQHDVMPGDLSELPLEYIQRAYARILEEKGAWKIKLAYFITEREQGGLDYALAQPAPQFLRDELAHGDIKLITCPADPDPPASGGRSYGINSIILTDVDGDGTPGTSRDYSMLPADTLLIADCEKATFTSASELAERHKLRGKKQALGIYKGKDVWEHEKGKKEKKKGGMKGPKDKDKADKGKNDKKD